MIYKLLDLVLLISNLWILFAIYLKYNPHTYIQRFNSKATKSVIYTIYFIIFLRKQTKNLTTLLIIKLDVYPIIFGCLSKKIWSFS